MTYASGGNRAAILSMRPRRSIPTERTLPFADLAPAVTGGGGTSMSSYETVAYEESNGVAWITLNRPEVYNAFNGRMAQELRDIWRGLRHNTAVNCAVLTAAG